MLNLMTIPSGMIVPEIDHAQLAGYSNPELDYAQVLADAHAYLATQQAGSRSPLSTRLNNAYRSSQGKSKESSSPSWKTSLFFWRKHRKQKDISTFNSPQHPLSRSRSKPAGSPSVSDCRQKKVKSGPIYSGETPCVSSHRSSRFLSGPISGSTSSAIPYRQLEHRTRPLGFKAPIYMVS